MTEPRGQMALYALVRRRSDETGATPSEIARRADISRALLSKWKAGHGGGLPTRPRLELLANELRLPYEGVLRVALYGAGYVDDLGPLGVLIPEREPSVKAQRPIG